MTRTAVDASVVVAALLTWHEHHEVAFSALEQAIEESELVLPLSALIECYAVLTRLPAAHRLSPEDAAGLLASALCDVCRLSAVRASTGWKFLAELVDEEVRGGATYDRRILVEAHVAAATRLLTMNGGDFRRLGSTAIEIHVPGETDPGSG